MAVSVRPVVRIRFVIVKKWSVSFKGDNFKQRISIWREQIVHLGCKSSLALVWIWFWRWPILQRSKPGLPEKYWSRYFGIFKYWISGPHNSTLVVSNGGNSIRFWLHPVGSGSSPKWDKNGYVTGTDKSNTLIDELRFVFHDIYFQNYLKPWIWRSR